MSKHNNSRSYATDVPTASLFEEQAAIFDELRVMTGCKMSSKSLRSEITLYLSIFYFFNLVALSDNDKACGAAQKYH